MRASRSADMTVNGSGKAASPGLSGQLCVRPPATYSFQNWPLGGVG